MRKIRILFALEATTNGGALKHLLYLVQFLDKNTFDITVLISPKRCENIQEVISKISSYRVRIKLLPIERQVSLVHDSIAFAKALFFLFFNRFDIVHAHSSKAGFVLRWAAWISRVPFIVYTPHCFYFMAQKGIKRRFYLYLEKITVRITNKIVVARNEQVVASTEKLAPAGKLIVINNAIPFFEYRRYDKAQAKKEMGISTRYVVSGIGRLAPQKDWQTFVHAAQEVLNVCNDITFIIAGNGEQNPLLNKLISEAGLQNRVVTLGYVKDIGKVYSASDVVVSTSLYEGLPYVLLEAMYYRVPMITTDIGYYGIIEDNVNAYLFPSGNYKVLADKILYTIADGRKSQEICMNSFNKLQAKFSFETFIRKHNDLYLQGIARPAPM